MLKIGGLQKLTLIDYPGKIACTVFFAGCSFRCPWCYNPELVLPEKIKKQPLISEKDFFDFLKERKDLLDGVVLSGGEPCIFQDLTLFVEKIKKLGFSIKLDTNGSNPKKLKELIDKKLIDYVALDIKAPPEKYAKLIGLENQIFSEEQRFRFWADRIVENVKESISLLKEKKVSYEFRTTLVPSLLKKKDVLKIARWIGPDEKYYLQNFRPEKTLDPYFKKVKSYSEDKLLEIQKAIAPLFDICQIR